jgi:hypothetical protein
MSKAFRGRRAELRHLGHRRFACRVDCDEAGKYTYWIPTEAFAPASEERQNDPPEPSFPSYCRMAG